MQFKKMSDLDMVANLRHSNSSLSKGRRKSPSPMGTNEKVSPPCTADRVKLAE